MRWPAGQRSHERGFTLIESLVALALMGLVLSALANLTGHWLPNWNRGLNRIQRSELIGVALQRIADDLAAAENVPASRGNKQPLFSGSDQSVTFVRTTLGPNASPGLDVVHLGETTDREGLATVRSRTAFHPVPPEATVSDQLRFGDPVVLMRAPFRLSFAYAGEDQVWKSRWQDPERLPAKIRLTVRDTSTERAPSLTTVATVHVQASAQGNCQQADGRCDDNAQTNSPGSTTSQQAGSTGTGQGSSR